MPRPGDPAGDGLHAPAAPAEGLSQVEQQILNYYNGQLLNEGPDCLQTEMQGISALRVLRDTPRHVVVSVQYFFQSMDYDEHSGVGCQGSDTRVFTFDKVGGGLTVASMGQPLSEPYGNE